VDADGRSSAIEAAEAQKLCMYLDLPRSGAWHAVFLAIVQRAHYGIRWSSLRAATVSAFTILPCVPLWG
jgi:hypothetical protein